MALPGNKNWWDMTAGEIDDMNRARCGDMPFGGRGDPDCARFLVEPLKDNHVSADPTSQNRTSKFYDFSKQALGSILPGAGIAIAGAEAVAEPVKDLTLGTATKFLQNGGLVIVGIIIIIGSFMLWKSSPLRIVGKYTGVGQ